MFVAAAAMTFIGCSKENVSENGMPVTGEKVVRSFVAEFATSRTALNDAMTRMVWSEGDQLGIYTDVETDLNVESSTYTKDAGNFSAQIDAAATKVYAYYPYYEGQGTRTHKNVSLYIEDAQTQSEAGVLNGNMVGMYASAAIAGEGQNTVLTFDPIASIIAFNIYDLENTGEAVKSVTFTPADGALSCGQHVYNLETGITDGADKNKKASATVTLTTPYVVPAEKPADKSGYIYLAVSPKNYSGGTFTVVTDAAKYTFTTESALDLTNVYAPLTIPMNLAKVRQPAPTVDHVFYDDFSTATGSGSTLFSLKVSPEDYAYYYTDPYTTTVDADGKLYVYDFKGAIKMGSSSKVVTITTPALKLIEGTKNLQVTFYANGWKSGQTLNVTASTGTVVGGSDLEMPQATSTSASEMNKSAAAFFTVYVENADATTTLTFGLANSVDKRFMLDDLTVDVHEGAFVFPPAVVVEQATISDVPAEGVADQTFTFEIRNDNGYTASVTCDGTVVTSASIADKTVTYTVSENTDTENGREGWITITLNDEASTSATVTVQQLKMIATIPGETLAYTFDVKNGGLGSGYGLKTGVLSNNGMTWTVTFGQQTYIGTNKDKDNKLKCKLGADYEKVGTPMGYTADQTQIVGIITENPMANIGKVVVSGDTDKYNPENISLVYSVDNGTYTLVETQPYDQSAGNTWTFTPVPNAYYAVVMQYGGSSYMRTNNLKVEYYTVQQ